MALDHSILLNGGSDEQDILNEFLDQRVFDSLNNNTPEPGLAATENISELDQDLFAKLRNESLYTMNGGANFADLHLLHENDDYLFTEVKKQEPESVYGSPRYCSPRSDSAARSSLLDYETVRKELLKVKFGNSFIEPPALSVEINDPLYLDFSEETMRKLPYSLELLGLPSYSRVETQIKLKFKFSPGLDHHLLHIPQDLISKSKFFLQEPVENLPELLKSSMLFMDVFVVTSNLNSCAVCPRCIKREQKRASRSKNGPIDSNGNSPTLQNLGARTSITSWSDESMIKKAIIFNCKEIMSFPAPSGLADHESKILDFSARIVCYCRHHGELKGFKLLFVVKDYKGVVVAKHMSTPIMIMDRKKGTMSRADFSSVSTPKAGSSSNHLGISDHDVDSKQHPLSPNSMDDSTSEAFINTDSNNDVVRGMKRKKLSIDDSYASSNPMYSGGNGFSPISNSDTNMSVHNMNNKAAVGGSISGQSFPLVSLPRQASQLQLVNSGNSLPAIQKIIPSQGPVRGGIEVTLLGFNFRPGLIVKFGSKNALATHCWSESTIVTYLPPAAKPGQVLVSFENQELSILGSQQLIFTYTDDTDRQLIELALQIVGLKMNGKLEDAKNIAKRIVGSDNSNGTPGAQDGDSSSGAPGMNQASLEWYDNAHKAVEKLTKSGLSTEEILINFLSLVDLPNCPIIIPNWQLANGQGQALLHLATLKNYTHLVKFLITHGCKIDLEDNQGLTPLFFASMCGHREMIRAFLDCKANWSMRLSNDKYLKDYCDLNVLDIFERLSSDAAIEGETTHESGSEVSEERLLKLFSVDSLNSLYTSNYGRHISRMVMDSTVINEEKLAETGTEAPESMSEYGSPMFGNESSDFADSELDSDNSLDRDIDFYADDDEDDDTSSRDYDDYDSSDYDIEDDEAVPRHHPLLRPNPGLWQKMKNAVFSNEAETDLPTYDDLFPFGGAFGGKPKTIAEQELNGETSSKRTQEEHTFPSPTDSAEDAGILSDSSEDMTISYAHHPRKPIGNDKMLLFFWLPVLVMIVGIFAYMSLTGVKIEIIESFKERGRNAIGNLVVGNERLSRVFVDSSA